MTCEHEWENKNDDREWCGKCHVMWVDWAYKRIEELEAERHERWLMACNNDKAHRELYSKNKALTAQLLLYGCPRHVIERINNE